ncbi:hypothetical protein HDV63DRAFT_360669 [Trichoderma sp. SZMC 28014]
MGKRGPASIPLQNRVNLFLLPFWFFDIVAGCDSHSRPLSHLMSSPHSPCFPFPVKLCFRAGRRGSDWPMVC